MAPALDMSDIDNNIDNNTNNKTDVTNKSPVRALYRAVVIPGLDAPYNVAHLKVFYPAVFCGSDLERNTGLVQAKATESPMPVVILMPGINLGCDAYQWLAEILAQREMVVVTYNLVAEEMPGYIAVTPGLDLNFIRPSSYGSAPSANAIKPILNELAKLQSDGPLAAKLDLNCVVLGGHSAGGTAALLNANPDWFPSIKGVFSYAAHAGASTALGFAPNTSLTIDNRLPVLMLGGTEDGCIAESHTRYGVKLQGEYYNDATARLEQTFEQSISPCSEASESSSATPLGHKLQDKREDKHLVLIDGANHFAIAHPLDHTAGRSFIDRPSTQPEQTLRLVLSDLIVGFITQWVSPAKPSSPSFEALLEKHHALIALHLKK